MPSNITPIRADNAVIATMRSAASTTTQINSYPNAHPTFELVRMLPGPSTIDATMIAGPNEASRPRRGGGALVKARPTIRSMPFDAPPESDSTRAPADASL